MRGVLKETMWFNKLIASGTVFMAAWAVHRLYCFRGDSR